MQTKTLPQWLAHLETAHHTPIDMGLERVTQVKNAMNLAPACPIITVGGTNGKGSTCAFLSYIYAAAGYKVGTLTSPHLLRFNERIAINNQPVSDEEIVEAFERIEAARGDVSLTYFEFNTLAAVDIFGQHQVDVMILEVGLGGRLDAVNIFDTDCAIVTSVDLDHQDYLGDSIEQIGKEKAGIFRAGKPAIFGQDPAPHSLGQHAKNIGAKLLQLNHQFSYIARIDSWQWQANNGSLKIDLPLPALQGAFQLNNAACAVAAVQIMRQQLPVSNEALAQGIAQAQNRARFQIIQQQPEIILDVAHNPHAARALASSLKNLPAKRTLAVFSILADKDSDSVISILRDSIDEWFIAPLDLPRGMTLTALTAKLKKHDIKAIHPHNTIQAAYTAALSQVTENDRIIVFGSFHTVAGILGCLSHKTTATASERPVNMKQESQNPQPEHHEDQAVLDAYEHLKNKNRRRLIGAGAITVLAGGLFAAVASNGPKDNIEPKMAQPQQQQHVTTEVLRPSGAQQAASTVPTLSAAQASHPASPSAVVQAAKPLPQERTSAKPRVQPAETMLDDADTQASLAEERRLRREEQRKAKEQRRLEQQQAREEAARKRAEARQERAEARARAEQERIAKARADEARRKQAQEVVAKAEAERAAKQKAALERAAEQKAAADEARRAERAKLLAQQKAAERAAQAKAAVPKKADDKAASKTTQTRQPEKAVASKDNREKRASVQVGAYRDINAAKAAQQKMKGLNYSSSIEEVNTDKGKVYRLKTGSFPNRSEAELAASKLKARGLGGIVLEQK